MPQAAVPSRPRYLRVRTFGRWDCINARQRERAKEPRFAAGTSLLRSPATRRRPPKCGAFRLQRRGSRLRQTGCWSKGDSNSWSHPERQRSEGATWVPPLLPVSESRPPEKRQRSAELSATASAVATPFHVGVPNAHTPIALSSIVRIASIVTGSFRLSSMRRTRMGLHDGNWT